MTVVRFPLAWAQDLIESADGPVPEYGSADWIKLPDDSRSKVAACVQAAELWRARPRTFEAPAPGSRRARDIAEARRPRPGDYCGGPIPWEPEGATSDG